MAMKKCSYTIPQELDDVLTQISWYERSLRSDGRTMSKSALIEEFCWQSEIFQIWAEKLGIARKKRKGPGRMPEYQEECQEPVDTTQPL